MNENWFFKKKVVEIEPQEIKYLPAIIEKGKNIEVVEAEIIEEKEILYNPFGWEVEECKIYDRFGNEIENWKELKRNDTNETLNICKKSYKPTTNEYFSETVLRIQEITGFKIEMFEEAKNGKVLFAKLKNEGFKIAGHNFFSYMVVGNSHNSESAFFIGEHNTMTRCNNQFATVGQNLKACHTASNEQQIKRILEYFQQFTILQQNTIDFLQKLENLKMNQAQARKLVNYLLELPENYKFDDLSTRKQNIINTLTESVIKETQAIGMNGLGVFQGVTYWTTHERKEPEKIYSQFFGSSADYNKKAMTFLNNELLNN